MSTPTKNGSRCSTFQHKLDIVRERERERERDIDVMERIKTNVLYLNLSTLSNNNH
jgi:hypothetical protein